MDACFSPQNYSQNYSHKCGFHQKLHFVPSNRRLCSKNILSHPETFIHAIASRRSTRGMPHDPQQLTGINTQPSYSFQHFLKHDQPYLCIKRNPPLICPPKQKKYIFEQISLSTVSLHNHIIVSIAHQGMLRR